MCKLYADWSPRRSSSTLNRSHSFSGGDTSHEKDAEKEGSFFENNSTKEQSEVVGEETTEKISPPQRKGSFRLFRSNSWTTAKRNKKTEVKITSPTTTITNTIENQRCSPSYSTKSQDSGFSENAAAPTANNNNNTGTSCSNTAQSIQNQRLQFLRLVILLK